MKVSYNHGDLSHFLHSHSEWAWFRLSPADERASLSDGHMSMLSWGGMGMGRHWHGVRSSWVMGMGMHGVRQAGYGRGVRGAWGARVGGRSPMAMTGGGGEWGPHTKESIKCIPQSGTLKNQKKSLFRSHRSA